MHNRNKTEKHYLFQPQQHAKTAVKRLVVVAKHSVYNWAISRWRKCACVHFLSAICDHKQELLDTVAKHRFV